MMLFLGDVSEFSVSELIDWVAKEFQVDRRDLENYDFIVASVEEEQYESNSFFLIRNRETGEYYEVNAGHCSCMGYEGQWVPEIASTAYLLSPQYKPLRKEVQDFVRSLFN